MRVLHVGSGGAKVPTEFFSNYEEVSLDIDPRCSPDMVGSMVDMTFVPDESFDAIYTCHTLEHLYPHDVRRCLTNFSRVLKPGGLVMIVVPDLEYVQPTEDILYVSESGPICGLDMYYGKHDLVEKNEYMAHHCGFVADTLRSAIENSNLKVAEVFGDSNYNLHAVAYKERTDVLPVD